MEDFIINILSNVGVPSAIAFYVLIRVNSNLNELSKAVTKLSYTLENRNI